VVGWALGIAFIVVFWRRLVDEPVDWAELWRESDKPAMALASIGLVIGQTIRSQLGRATHHLYALDLSRTDSYRGWFLSQIAKYIPGAVWLFPARVVFYRTVGTPTTTAAAIVTWELVALLLSALVVVATSFGTQVPWSGVATSLAVVAIATTVLLLSPVIRDRLRTAQLPGPWGKLAALLDDVEPKHTSAIWRMSAISLAAWIVTGLSFWAFVGALGIGYEPGPWEATVVFVTAWASGFVVVFAPAGLGAREGVMTALVAPAIGAGPALVLALAARAWVSAVEVFGVAVAALLVRSRDR
jgi:hypothetical protein